MAQFITIARRKIEELGEAAFTPELNQAEGRRVRQLYGLGKLRQIWKRAGVAGGVILWEADTEAEVMALYNSLPMAAAGMLEMILVAGLEAYPGISLPE